MRLFNLLLLGAASVATAASAEAQQFPAASINEMAETPLVRVNIAESLHTPPDEASLTVGTQAKAQTATAAVAANKVKTERLLATIRSAGLRERVIFAGFVDDVASWLKRAGAMVAVSRFEGHPNAVLEAMAAGLPVVVGRLPDHVAGALWRNGVGSIVWVNAVHSVERQRFTVAHELGHVGCRHADIAVDTTETISGVTRIMAISRRFGLGSTRYSG